MEPVSITKKELDSLKIIGRGTDGIIYKKDNHTLYKVYHEYIDSSIIEVDPRFDNEGVNITPTKEMKNVGVKRNIIQYLDRDGVRLSRQEAIEKAIQRQKYVDLTNLPQNALVVDGLLKGCVLYYHQFCTNIYFSLNFPLHFRKQILTKILLEVEELYRNYIYHIDLCQRPTPYSKNTNILLSSTLMPKIIDIDGHSAIYSEIENPEIKRISELGLSTLFLEILSQENLAEYLNNGEMEELYERLGDSVPSEIINAYVNNELTLRLMKEYLQSLQKNGRSR